MSNGQLSVGFIFNNFLSNICNRQVCVANHTSDSTYTRTRRVQTQHLNMMSLLAKPQEFKIQQARKLHPLTPVEYTIRSPGPALNKHQFSLLWTNDVAFSRYLDIGWDQVNVRANCWWYIFLASQSLRELGPSKAVWAAVKNSNSGEMISLSCEPKLPPC